MMPSKLIPHPYQNILRWDLAYLKFCCKVQGIRNELFANDICKVGVYLVLSHDRSIPELYNSLTLIFQVVALEEIKGHFPSGTTFEDYWPAKGSIEPVASR